MRQLWDEQGTGCLVPETVRVAVAVHGLAGSVAPCSWWM
jgi:hypothetical protein